MSESFEGAVLMVPSHDQWLKDWLVEVSEHCRRIRFQCCAPSFAGQWTAGDSYPPQDWLLRDEYALRRFDFCVLPVTLQTLGWTRTLLSCAQQKLRVPVLALVDGVQSPGLADLYALGVDDFVAHTATARNGAWDVMIPANATKSVVLKTEGTVDFYCKFHPNMTGQVSVAK